MKISNTYRRLSVAFKNQYILTNPEPFLGPNWETVLRWWLYYESLTDDQVNEFRRRRLYAIDNETCIRAWGLARNAADEVIGEYFRDKIKNISPYPGTLTTELIAMHLLFERGHQLTFVPLIKDL
jgi:hypothetical protein